MIPLKVLAREEDRNLPSAHCGAPDNAAFRVRVRVR